MKVGCSKGWEAGGEIWDFITACDLSCSAIDYAVVKFRKNGSTPRYLSVNPAYSSIAQRVLFAYALERGLKQMPLTLLEDPSLPVTYEGGIGWLVTDEKPDGAIVADWDYEMPKAVYVRDGRIYPAKVGD